MGWLDWFGGKGVGPAEVGCDLHTHLLPGVDDGVASLDEAERCIRSLMAMGYRGTVVTPHIYPEVFDNNEDALREAFADLQAQMADRVPGFALQLGAEYFFEDTLTRRITDDADRLLRFGQGQRLLLVELPMVSEPLGVEALINVCTQQGMVPILAHVERYLYGEEREDAERLTEWREAGALLQANIGSFGGAYGRRVKERALAVWRRELVDLLGTDMHRPSDAAACEAGWRWLSRHGGAFNASVQKDVLNGRLDADGQPAV